MNSPKVKSEHFLSHMWHPSRFTYISEIASLVTLNLEDTGITDAGVIDYCKAPGPANLENLDLSRTQITHNVISSLSSEWWVIVVFPSRLYRGYRYKLCKFYRGYGYKLFKFYRGYRCKLCKCYRGYRYKLCKLHRWYRCKLCKLHRGYRYKLCKFYRGYRYKLCKFYRGYRYNVLFKLRNPMM